MENRPIYISLVGGLGNQLFQLSAGLFFQGTQNLQIIDSLGSTRVNAEGLPELFSFHLPADVKRITTKKTSNFLKRLVNISLRMSLSEKRFILPPLFLARIISSIVASIYFRRRLLIKTSKGIGFSQNLKVQSSDLLVGYFQSFKWASDEKVFGKMMLLEPKELSDEFVLFLQTVKKVKPIIVHIRLGDYAQETNIGVLKPEYYINALHKLRKKEVSREIWIFSDQPQIAKSYFQLDKYFTVKYVSDYKYSTAHTFQIMRFGSAYVIANSTFSWWSAFLRYDRTAPVVAPNPWFVIGYTPFNLIPEDWHLISRE